MRTIEQNSKVGITLRLMGTPGTAAVDNGTSNGILTGNAPEKPASCGFGV